MNASLRPTSVLYRLTRDVAVPKPDKRRSGPLGAGFFPQGFQFTMTTYPAGWDHIASARRELNVALSMSSTLVYPDMATALADATRYDAPNRVMGNLLLDAAEPVPLTSLEAVMTQASEFALSPHYPAHHRTLINLWRLGRITAQDIHDAMTAPDTDNDTDTFNELTKEKP